MHSTFKYSWGCVILQCGRSHPPTFPCNTNYFCKNIKIPPSSFSTPLSAKKKVFRKLLTLFPQNHFSCYRVTMEQQKSASTSNKKLNMFPCQFTKGKITFFRSWLKYLLIKSGTLFFLFSFISQRFTDFTITCWSVNHSKTVKF